MFGCYRSADAADPATYIAAVARVLSMYDASLIRDVTDPLTGIQTTEKHATFMPNAGEIKIYCDGLASRRERYERLGARQPDPALVALPAYEPQPGDLASVFVPATNKRYPELLKWSQATKEFRKFRFEQGRAGIWVAWDIWDGPPMRLPKDDAPLGEPRTMQLSEATRKAMGLIPKEDAPL